MSSHAEYELEEGGKVAVTYDDAGRECLKITTNASGETIETIEYRYSKTDQCVEWKWYRPPGKLWGSFMGEKHKGDVINVKRDMHPEWRIPG